MLDSQVAMTVTRSWSPRLSSDALPQMTCASSATYFFRSHIP
jgi:hypothetical protein